MKLLTKEIQKKLPAIYATEKVELSEKQIICKFFNPCGAGTWYVIEGAQEENDFIFWGLVDLHEKEFGYFSLAELESIRLPYGLKIERVLHFTSCKVKEVMGEA